MKLYCMLLSNNEKCSFQCFPPLPHPHSSVSEPVMYLNILIYIAEVPICPPVKLFTNLIFQASNVTTAVLGLSVFSQRGLCMQVIS